MRAHLAWWSLLLGGLAAETTLLPLLLADDWRPDITRSLVLWAALTGIPRGGAFLAVAAGFVLDVASGAPLGFGAMLRLLIYGAARPFRGVFFDDYPVLLVPVAAVTGLGDAFGAFVLSAFAFNRPFPAAAVASVAWRQSLVEALVIPFVFLALEVASGRRPARGLSRGLVR